MKVENLPTPKVFTPISLVFETQEELLLFGGELGNTKTNSVIPYRAWSTLYDHAHGIIKS